MARIMTNASTLTALQSLNATNKNLEQTHPEPHLDRLPRR